MPDWGKMNFHTHAPKPWSELLPGVSETARDLINRLVKYSGSQRLEANKVK
jgi:hypothetical protein